MKKLIVLLIGIISLIPLFAQDIHTVYLGDTLQNVIDAANAGDFIYVHGGMNYGSITIDKRINLVGTGYFLGENENTQYNQIDADLNSITINEGGDYTMLTGFDINNIYLYDVNNVLIMKNNMNYLQISNCTNIDVWQNYEFNFRFQGSNSLIRFYNNIRLSPYSSSGVFSGEFINNYIINGTWWSNSIYRNNIILDSFYNTVDKVIENNIFLDVVNTNYSSSNIFDLTEEDIFVGFPDDTDYSTDGKYQIKAGSAAIGAGDDGTDIGPFGGPYPYVLSGMPYVPHIYQLIIPPNGATGTELNIQVKAKVGQ